MPLRVISLNVNSIVHNGRKTLLSGFIESNPADIYLFQETKLDSSIKLYFPNFNILRGDVRRGFGGTAIFVRHGIRIRNVSVGRGVINFTGCEILISEGWHRLVSVYITQSSNNIFNELGAFYSKFTNSLFGGDFNARHTTFGDISDNFYGRKLADCVPLFNLQIINPPGPTCFHSNTGSHIDKFISANFSFLNSNIDILPSFSDHAAISISIFCDTPSLDNNISYSMNFHLARMDPMNRFIERNLNSLPLATTCMHSNAELDSIAINMDDIFQRAISKFVPRTRNISQQVKLSSTTRALQSESKRLQRSLHNVGPFPNPVFANTLRTRIRLLNTMVNLSVKADCSRFFCNLYDNVKTTHDSFKFIKRYTGLRSTVSPNGIFTNDKRDTFLSEPLAIADSLGRLFSDNNGLTFNNISSNSLPVAIDNHIIGNCNSGIIFDADFTANTSSNRVNGPNMPFDLTTSEEVSLIAHTRPNKKSSGRDTMPYFIIKKFSPDIFLFLATFFNHCLANCHFPSTWKHAIITPIPKPGKDGTILSNWRPISQLNCVSKIFERILMNRVGKILCNPNLLPNQFGFLSGHSTEHALSRMQADIDDGLNNGKITSILSLDLKAAFDVIWIDGLIHKLCKLGVHPALIKIIKSMLTGRTFAIRLGNAISGVFNMLAGVPQGSVSGPQLFNYYMYDLPTDPALVCNQFADDTSYFLTHNCPGFAQNILNKHIISLSNYFRDWKMILNHDKTEFINIIGQCRDTRQALRRAARNMKIMANGHLINHSSVMRLLGVYFRPDNRFINHINIRLKKANYAKFKLTRLFKRLSIPINTKSSIYKMYVRPILTYASPVWCRPPLVSSHQMERLRLFERGILRSATNTFRDRGSYIYPSASTIYRVAGCSRIDKYMAERQISFFEKLKSSSNPKFGNIISTRQRGTGRYPVIDLLHVMHEAGQFRINNEFSLFNTRYNHAPGMVYSLEQ